MGSPGRRAPGVALRPAWLSLVLVLPCLVLAFVLREGIVSMLGYGGRPDAPPTWVMLAAAPALLVRALPMIPTWH
jgi:hypothetical protein